MLWCFPAACFGLAASLLPALQEGEAPAGPKVVGAPFEVFLDVCRTPGVPPEDIVAYINDVGGVGFEVTPELLSQLRAQNISPLVIDRLAQEISRSPERPPSEPAEPAASQAPISLDRLGGGAVQTPLAPQPPLPRLVSRPTILKDPAGHYLDLISTYEVSRGEGVTPPRLIESKAFNLPNRIKQMMLRNQRYVIHLRVHIGPDGAIQQYDILRMTPTNMPGPLRDLLERELQEWVASLRYEPARFLGQPIETYDSHLFYITNKDLVIPHGVIGVVFQ
jgi:hypothetical protein